MALCYRIPLPGLFYYSGRVGPRYWLSHSSHDGFVPVQRERVAVEVDLSVRMGTCELPPASFP